MGFLIPKSSPSPPSSLDSALNKTEPIRQEYEQGGLSVGVSNEDGTSLHRGLRARHITMVCFDLAVNNIQLIGAPTFLRLPSAVPSEQDLSSALVQPLHRLVQAPSSSVTPLSVSSCTSSCVPSVRWRHGFHYHLALPATLSDSLTPRLGFPWAIRECLDIVMVLSP
jgi:hypothetical protein